MRKDDSSNQNPSSVQTAEKPIRTWEEDLQFEVDGVTVKAHASYLGRGVKVVVLEPYKLDAFIMMPPLFAAGHAMNYRYAELKREGITETQDSIRRARNAYLEHLTYLKWKPEIDKLEKTYLQTVQDQLNTLKANYENATSHAQQEKIRLRKEHLAGLIGEHQRFLEVKKLDEIITGSELPYRELSSKVSIDLAEIKWDFLKQAANK